MGAIRRNAWVELDFRILCENLDAMRATLASSAEIILVIKANAYGHGMKTVASHAYRCGVRWFLVARLDEALEVRSAVPDARILLLGSVWPADIADVIEHRITPVLVSAGQAAELAAAARGFNATVSCHAKIDTGMGRFGFGWQEAGEQLAGVMVRGGIRIDGLCMHFASAGKPGDHFAMLQEERFRHVVASCQAHGLPIPFRHIANSAAFAAHPEWDMDGVRLGILMYGYGGRRAGVRVQTRPFLQWKTRIVQAKRVPAGFPVGYLSTYATAAPTWLGTIDVGYSDGFSRLMSNKGFVLVGGRRAPVVGRVTMNFTTVDLGPEGGGKDGDEVVLIGEQGGESLWADELARWCQTIPYEILTNIRSEPLVVKE